MKDFLIIGTTNSMTYKINEADTIAKKIQFSHSNRYFTDPVGNRVDKGIGAGWITTFTPVDKTEVEYTTTHQEFETIDGTDVRFFETCDQMREDDYDIMAVPISFLWKDTSKYDFVKFINPYVNGVARYKRLIVKRKV